MFDKRVNLGFIKIAYLVAEGEMDKLSLIVKFKSIIETTQILLNEIHKLSLSPENRDNWYRIGKASKECERMNYHLFDIINNLTEELKAEEQK